MTTDQQCCNVHVVWMYFCDKNPRSVYSYRQHKVHDASDILQENLFSNMSQVVFNLLFVDLQKGVRIMLIVREFEMSSPFLSLAGHMVTSSKSHMVTSVVRSLCVSKQSKKDESTFVIFLVFFRYVILLLLCLSRSIMTVILY